MKTRINLYSAEFKPKKEKLNLAQLISINILVLVVMLILSFLSISERDEIQLQVQKIDSDIIVQRQNNVELANKAAKNITNPGLEQQLVILKSKLTYQQGVLALLSGLSDVKHSGFSILMTDLARLRDSDIRLQQIQLNNSEMTFKGLARNHQAIPRWVRQFNQGMSLQDRKFSQLHIGRNDNDDITFTLTNSAKREGAE